MGVALVTLIVLHLIDGRTVTINPQQVTLLSDARNEDDKNKQLHKDVKCVVHLTDGRYVSVAEECSAVRKLMEGSVP